MDFPKVRQISESHCGPAVLQMLLSVVGVSVTQRQITNAAGAKHSISQHGVRVDQLAVANAMLAPHTNFWYKFHASLEDIERVLERGYVVGVEWQGLFYDTEEEEEEDEADDTGHYSIISHVDREQQSVIIVDPYKSFANQDRIFPIDMFLRRWWDTNEVRDPVNGKKTAVMDEQLLFFVAPKEVDFSLLGLTRFGSESSPSTES